jgi:hypothetical protein
MDPIGVTASILAIAEFGLNVAVKLVTFAETVQAAEKSVKRISNEISVTCGILWVKVTSSPLALSNKLKNSDKEAHGTEERLLGDRLLHFQGRGSKTNATDYR